MNNRYFRTWMVFCSPKRIQYCMIKKIQQHKIGKARYTNVLSDMSFHSINIYFKFSLIFSSNGAIFFSDCKCQMRQWGKYFICLYISVKVRVLRGETIQATVLLFLWFTIIEGHGSIVCSKMTWYFYLFLPGCTECYYLSS